MTNALPLHHANITVEPTLMIIPQSFAKVDKKDLIVTGTLGMGGFGRVELVCTYWLHLFVRLLVVCCCWYRDYVFTYICIMHSRINAWLIFDSLLVCCIKYCVCAYVCRSNSLMIRQDLLLWNAWKRNILLTHDSRNTFSLKRK